MSNKLCFIAVNYRNYLLTRQMYDSLQNASVDKFDFIVVDNSESDDEHRELLSIFSGVANVKILQSENEGYFAGLNFGLQNISLADYCYICIGNNDLVFQSDFVANLLIANYPPEALVICPDVVSSDGYHQNPHVDERFGFMRKAKMDVYYSSYYAAVFLLKLKSIFSPARVNQKDNQPKFIHMGIGAFYVIVPRFFDKKNSLYFPFFLYGEEAFLSNQVHGLGGRLYYDPRLVVFHKESATLSELPSRQKYIWSKQSYAQHRDYL